MDYRKLFLGIFLFFVMHTIFWFSTNLQFVKESWKDKSLFIAVCLAIPGTILAYYGARFTYEALGNTAWGSRFIGFGSSWFVFPVLTWLILRESMLTSKTLVCTALAFSIILIQIFWE